MKLAKQNARQVESKITQGKNGEPTVHRKVKRWDSRSHRSGRLLFAKECQTLREQELGFLNWPTSKIIKDHPNLVVEQLQILNLVKNHKLTRSKLEQKWEFFSGRLSTRQRELVGEWLK